MGNEIAMLNKTIITNLAKIQYIEDNTFQPITYKPDGSKKI